MGMDTELLGSWWVRGSWSQKFSYLSLKQVKGTMIKGVHKKTSIDSVSLDFKARPPRRTKEI